MGRADGLFAACAIAVALLAGAAGAVASADPADGPAGESTNASASDDDQSKDPSVDQSADGDAETYSGENDRDSGGEPLGDPGAQGSGDEHDGDDVPVDEDSGNGDNRDGKTAARVPMRVPELPAELIPIPEDLPPIPEEPPLPPADLPPVDPEPIDVTMVGPGASIARGNESPVMKLPVIFAPPAPPGHILGASITARGTLRPAFTSPSRAPGDVSPPPRQPTTGLREPPTSVGLSGPGQPANRTGYNKDGPPRVRLPEMAAGALPGVGGIIVMTAAGVCLGYRQAMAAHQLRAHGLDRFLA